VKLKKTAEEVRLVMLGMSKDTSFAALTAPVVTLDGAAHLMHGASEAEWRFLSCVLRRTEHVTLFSHN
jgi:hypothetical protein